MQKSQLALALGVAFTSLLTGCGGESSTETTAAAQTSYSVKAIDGYLRNATVWLDLDGDYQLDANEPSAISGDGGVAELDVTGIEDPSRYNVVVQTSTETVDEDTITESNPDGETVSTPYMMSAPAGSQTVTPLTTKVNLVLEQKKAEATNSSVTLTDEDIDQLKNAAINEVAGDNLDPDLLMGDYIEAKQDTSDSDAANDAARLAYEAKVLVESKQLPETPEELDQVLDEIQADPSSSTLLKQLDAVSEQTQKSIELAAKESADTTIDSINDLDFNSLALPDFVSEENVDSLSADPDNDGVATAFDAFPNNPNEWLDTDGDGIGNNKDTDDDGDGIADADDDLPLNAKESVDTDNDGLGNNADTDDDGDGVLDINDAFPLLASESSDNDKDGIGDNADTDDDNDGILDDVDPFPFNPDESADFDGDLIGDVRDTDDDNDGVLDTADAFPYNASEWRDSDKDGIGNNEDTDDDNDKVLDVDDAFPLNPLESLDTDGDGIGNNADTDDDNDGVTDVRDYYPLDSTRYSNGDFDSDGVSDIDDVFPSNPNEQYDADQDGIGDNLDTDDDNDGVLDTADAFPYNPKETADFDQDGIGDNQDSDDDNDGVADVDDAFPRNANETADNDRDGVGNNTDTDDDNDGILDSEDPFPFDADESADADQDGIGDTTDPDDDNDGVLDADDAFPYNANESVDTDKDGIGNNADTDDDNDGISDSNDAFPLDPTEYLDTDGDQIGNNADSDDDGDGVADVLDFFPLDSSESSDVDGDGIGDNADTDNDNDGVANDVDAFPLNPNESSDRDGDGVGDNSDAFPDDSSESRDGDKDGVGDNADLFPADATETIDTDGDGIGDNADTDDDNDGVADSEDLYPLDPTESADTDGDGIADNADPDADGNGILDALESAALQFLREADTLYELHDESYHDQYDNEIRQLYVSEILIADDKGTTQAPQQVNPDGTLSAVGEEYNEMILTEQGWVQVESYTLDASTDTPVAYPTNVPDSTMSVALELVPLAGQVIAEHSADFWNEFNSVTAEFPAGSQAVKFTPSADQDSYNLWTGYQVQVSSDQEPYHTAATSLDQLISDTAAVNPTNDSEVGLIYFGQDMAVELVADGSANYYQTSYSETSMSLTLVASASWSTTTHASGVELLEFTVPAAAITAYGDTWDHDSPVMFMTTYDAGDGSYVYMGNVELAGSSLDEVIYLYNDTAKSAILEQVVVTETDTDGDGVDDSVDTFPLDPNESVDTDNDGIGNNADSDDDNDGVVDAEDAFPLDPTESADTDGDTIGNNADTDDDGDGVADEDDAFPLDPTESVDTDNDGIGNNADTDDDGDNVADTLDVFPLDPTEWADTDGDNIGDNADPDANGNGIPDDEETPTVSDAIQFVRDAGTLYIMESDDEYDETSNTSQEFLVVEPVVISDNLGVTQTPQMVNADGTLTTVSDSYHEAILTSNGWTVTDSYTIDVTTESAVAYPTNASDSKFNLTMQLIDLTGVTISPESVPFWQSYQSETAQFPTGSQAVSFTPVAAQDIYSLWLDSQVSISTSTAPYYAAASSLDEIISATAADISSASPQLVYFGYDMGVELVDGGSANYYRTGENLTLLGNGNWTRSTINNEDILQFTVPESVITAAGDNWDHDSADMFASVYQDSTGSYVRMGSVERAGTSIDEVMYMYNDTAKTAILAEVVVNVADADGDGVADSEDAFPQDPNESVDTDNDGIGNNADTDDDGDGVADALDAFPLDPTESVDTDGDGIGDNADLDADGNGIPDSEETPIVSDAIQFVRDAGTLYLLDSDDEYYETSNTSREFLYVEQVVISDNLGTIQTPQMVNPDGTLTPVSDYNDEAILTSNGWTVTSNYTIDVTTENAVAYPGNVPGSLFNLSMQLVDLEGITISPDSVPFWQNYLSSTTQFPAGAQAVSFSPVAAQDIYWLWLDSQVNISTSTEPYYAAASSLDEIISAAAADINSTSPKLVYFSYDIGVELVNDGTANYYRTDSSMTLIDSGSWTRSTINGEDILQFTVPDNVIAAAGDNWDNDSADLFASVFQDSTGSYVRMGDIERAGSSFDETMYMYNDAALNAILDQVVVEADSDGDGVIDSQDAFPSDPTKWTDSSTGTDPGTDTSTDTGTDTSADYGDGPAIADGVGVTSDATDTDIVQFVSNNTGLYEFEQEGDNGMSVLSVDTFVVNGDLATSEGFRVIMSDGNPGAIMPDDEDLILYGSSWVTPAGYTLDLSGAAPVAYPTGYADLKYSLASAMITDLSGITINADNLPLWSDYQTGSAVMPSGAAALQFIPVAQQDIYSLWTDSDVYVSVVNPSEFGPYSTQATTLADLVSATAATSPESAKQVYIGYNIGVELIADGVAKFYMMDDTTYQTTMVGTTTWNSNEMGGKTVYQLTVPEDLLAIFGDAWYGDPSTLLFAEHNGIVVRGSVEIADQANDYQVTFFNDTAYQAIMDEVAISCDITSSQYDSEDQFFEKVALYQACSGTALPAISDTTVSGMALNRFDTTGLYSRMFFFDDYTMTGEKQTFDEQSNEYVEGILSKDWSVATYDGIDYIRTQMTYSTELSSAMVLLSEDNDKRTYAVYKSSSMSSTSEYLPSQTEVVTFIDVTYSGILSECSDPVNDVYWSNSSDSNYHSKDEYDALADACRADSGITTTYNDINLAGAQWAVGSLYQQSNGTGSHTVTAFIVEDEVILNADNTGSGNSVKYADESFTFSWNVNSLGQLVILPDDEPSQNIFTLTGIEGSAYAQKGYWQLDGDGEGEIFSATIMAK